MTHYLKAIYEDGVFRPLEPIKIAEHSEVSLLVETPDEHGAEIAPDLPIWEFAVQLMRDAPEEALQALPTDGASQHDHYLYGAPKHP
jgi:predicted DNA-binding antitoxin AbrB/MazE fold protein